MSQPRRRSTDRPRGRFRRAFSWFVQSPAVSKSWLLIISVIAVIGVFQAVDSSNEARQAVAAIQQSRSKASFDSCKLLQKLVYSAAKQQGGSAARAGAVRFLRNNDIYDCHKYVRDRTRLHVMPADALVGPPMGVLAPIGL